MIDTIKFKIKLNDYDIKRIKSDNTIYTKKIYLQNSEVIYKNINDKYKLGSYIDFVSIFIDTNDYLFLEFSITKYYYGHNVYLLSIDMFILLIDSLKLELEHTFNIDLPLIEEWELLRIDLCYSWKIENSQKVLNILKKYGSEKKSIYNTSISDNRTDYSIKWYLKEFEFKKHDYRSMIKSNFDNAVFLEYFSKDILRFEVTLRRKEIIRKKLNIFSFYDIENVYNILNEFLFKFTGMKNNIFREYKNVYFKLKSLGIKDSKCLRLSQFYYQWTKDEYSKNFLKSVLSKSTINRNKKELRDLGIGLMSNEYIQFDLSIPSDENVNEFGLDKDNSPYKNVLLERVTLDLPLLIE